MNEYTITVLDTDTYIERRIAVQASSAQQAHKDALWELNDLESEQITRVVNEHGQLVYTSDDGFLNLTT